MPFDSTTFTLPAVKPATFDPVLREGLAGLAQLSEALLRPEWWPTHSWRYSIVLDGDECGTAGCADGLRQVLWPETAKMHTRDLFHLTEAEDRRIFLNCDLIYGCAFRAVTPAMVANAIDALLAAKGWKG
jgi:hypothetical protein